MGSLDSNGIYIYDETDNVAPLHTLLNLGQASIGPALSEVKANVQIKPVASAAERNAYEQDMRAKGNPPTANAPLYVNRGDTGQVERHDGSGWKAVVGEPDRLRLFAGGTPLIGDNRAGALPTGIYVQGGTRVLTSNTSGRVSINFPKPFPNGVLTVILTNGHYEAAWVMPVLSETRLDGFSYITAAIRDGHYTGNVRHRLNWLALGW